MPTKNYNLFELQMLEGLSVRTLNVCERHGLTDIMSLVQYYKTHKTFLHLKNAGRRTDQELTLLCQLYDDESYEVDEVKFNDAVPYFPPLQPLSQHQRQALDNIARQKFAQLSQRGQNCLISFFQGAVTFEAIYQIFIKDKIEIKVDLPNSGVKTANELVSYIEILYSDYHSILELNDEMLKLEVFKGWLFWKYQVDSSQFKSFEQSFLENRFQLFRFIDYLINNEKLFSKRRSSLIFRNRSGYFKRTGIESLDRLGEMVSLTRERVRQIAEKVVDMFEEGLSALETQAGLLKSITSYEWNYDGDLIFTSNQYADKLNKSEGIDFQPALFTKVISFILKDSHCFFSGSKKPSLSDCCIRLELTASFNFRALWDDVFNQISEDIPQKYSLNFEGYLIGFFANSQLDLLPRIANVCLEILQRDFPEQLFLDFEGNIVFHRNTFVRVAEYAAKVLENENRPMHIKKIHEKMMEIYPDYKGDYDTLRSHLNRDKDTFIYFGRKSTYGLREWESKIKGIKGGTIRSITEEYLEKFDEPKHISEILEYVLKFRPKTNERSLFGNLQLEMNGKFILFKGGFWGLSDKRYPSDKTQIKNLPGSINRQIMFI